MFRRKITTLLFFILCSSISIAQNSSDIVIGQTYEIQSAEMGEKREYRVLLPKEYESKNKAFPVIYVLDGQAYFLSAYSSVIALSGLDAMPEAIVVAISNHDRTSDMTPPDMDIPGVQAKNADRFLEFLTKELIPKIDRTYRTLPLRILIGHSHGGIFGLYALTKASETFRWHIVLDPPMHLNQSYLERIIDDHLTQNSQFSSRLVIGWNRYSWSDENWKEIQRKPDTGLRAWEIDLDGETHSSMYHMGIYKGLKQLFADHNYKHNQVLTFEALKNRYQRLNEEYGYSIPIPIWALRYGAIEHLTSADPDMARPFINALKILYGTTDMLGDDTEQWLNQLVSNPPEITRAEYLDLKDADVKESSDFFGIWENEEYKIELKEEKGRVVGRLGQRMPDGEWRFQGLIKVIRKTNGDLEIVHPNGVPPLSGLIVYRLSVPDNNRTKVEQRFMVYWPSMQGRNRPKIFTLKKN